MVKVGRPSRGVWGYAPTPFLQRRRRRRTRQTSFDRVLVGHTTERTRKTIGLFYAISAILAGTELILWSRGDLLDPSFPKGQEIFVSMIIIGSLSGITAWFLTLVQFARVHAWGSFYAGSLL